MLNILSAFTLGSKRHMLSTAVGTLPPPAPASSLHPLQHPQLLQPPRPTILSRSLSPPPSIPSIGTCAQLMHRYCQSAADVRPARPIPYLCRTSCPFPQSQGGRAVRQPLPARAADGVHGAGHERGVRGRGGAAVGMTGVGSGGSQTACSSGSESGEKQDSATAPQRQSCGWCMHR